MGKNDNGYRYEYVVTGERYDAYLVPEAHRDSIIVRRVEPGGAVTWDLSVTRRDFSGGDVLEMTMHDSAWRVFDDVPHLFRLLRAENVHTMGHLRQLLGNLGFNDATERSDPDDGIGDAAAEGEVIRLVADMVVFRRDRVSDYALLTVRRAGPPFQGELALPGGGVNSGERSFDAALRELEEETGLRLNRGELSALGVYADPGRDPRGRYVAFAFTATVSSDWVDVMGVKAGSDAAAVEWVPVRDVVRGRRTLAFDHGEIVRQAALDCAIPID